MRQGQKIESSSVILLCNVFGISFGFRVRVGRWILMSVTMMMMVCGEKVDAPQDHLKFVLAVIPAFDAWPGALPAVGLMGSFYFFSSFCSMKQMILRANLHARVKRASTQRFFDGFACKSSVRPVSKCRCIHSATTFCSDAPTHSLLSFFQLLPPSPCFLSLPQIPY